MHGEVKNIKFTPQKIIKMMQEDNVSVDIKAINEKIEKESAFVDLLML